MEHLVLKIVIALAAGAAGFWFVVDKNIPDEEEGMLFEDKRLIRGIYYPEDCSSGYTVGRRGITKITVVEENGQMAPVAWFEIWEGDELRARLNAAHITEVTYQ